MIADVLRWVIGGFLAPQATVRRLVDGNHGYEVAAQLFLLGFLIDAIVLVAFGASPEASPAVGYVGRLLMAVLQLALMVFLVFRLGRMSGGTGSFMDTVIGMAWWSLMSALMLPVLLPFWLDMTVIMDALAEGKDASGLPQPAAAATFGATIAIMTIFWLLANTVTAIHRFENIWGVLGVIVGIPFALFMLVTMISGGGA